MGAKALVSVIIPTYNRSSYLVEAVDSVLRQTYDNLEVIVVDDGSTDDTSSVMRRYAKDSRVKYVYQDNAKQSAARNNGIRHAKGKFVAFLDDDDIWMSDKLEKQMKVFDDGAGLVYSGAFYFDDASGKKIYSTGKDEFLGGNVFFDLLMNNPIAASSVVVRKDCFSKSGLFKEDHKNVQFGEDYDVWLRIAHDFKLGFVRENLVKIRSHEGGASRADFRKVMRSEVMLKRRVMKRFGVSFFKVRRVLGYTKARLFFEEGYKYRKESKVAAFFYYLIAFLYRYDLKYLSAMKKLFIPGYYKNE